MQTSRFIPVMLPAVHGMSTPSAVKTKGIHIVTFNDPVLRTLTNATTPAQKCRIMNENRLQIQMDFHIPAQ